MAWDLEAELLAILGGSSLPQSLASSGLCKIEDFRGLRVERTWYRSGAETYFFVFSVLRQNLPATRLGLKACAPTSLSSRSIPQILDDWLFRRRSIASSGAKTPQLFGVGRGILLEEFIPFELSGALERLRPMQRLGLAKSAAASLGTVIGLGYRPTCLVRDLRSRGDSAVVVDFGSDLGSQDRALSIPLRLYDDLAYLEQIAEGIRADLATDVRDAYRNALATSAEIDTR